MDHEPLCQSILDYLTSVVLLDIDRQTSLAEGDILDSFDRVGLIGHLEQLLDISVEPEQFGEAPFENIDTLANWALALQTEL
jgi:acyl carrier protein